MNILHYASFVFSAALAAGVVCFLRTMTDYAAYASDVGSWGVFFTVFGVLYAIMLGFLLVEALNKYNDLSATLDQELNQLQDIRDALIYLDNSEKIEDNIRQKLKVYAESVSGKEWDEMTKPKTDMSSDTSEELYDLMKAVHDIEITNDSDREVLKLIMGKTFEITTLRTQRINLSNQTLPQRLLALIAFMSLVLIAGFALMGVDQAWVHVFMVAALTAAAHLLYAVMRDLDNPFVGVWNLSHKEFDDFAKSI